MYSNFKEQAIEYVRQAIAEDTAGNYAKAFSLYMNALEYFKTHLKYEKNPKIKEAIMQKFTEYLRRAEEIRAVLDEGGSGPPAYGVSVVVARPETKPKDGNEGVDGDKEKLRAELNSAIIREELAWKGIAEKIIPPPISKTDSYKVLARQRPTMNKSDPDVHERFTKEFGEEDRQTRGSLFCFGSCGR